MELLRLLGVPFEAAETGVDEPGAASPAVAKAEAASKRGDVTLAADTQVILDGERLGKPRDDSHAVAMLASLAGGEHDVRTEVVVDAASGARIRFAVTSRVTFRGLSMREIERYVATGEPAGKAGAYAIQGEGRRLVEAYEGCLANVIGLPLCHAYFALRRAGVVGPDRPERVCQRHFDFVCPVWRSAQRQGRVLHDGAEVASWLDDVSGMVAP